MMELKIFKRASDLELLRPAWDALWNDCESAGVQSSYAWFLAGWRAFHQQDQLYLMTVSTPAGELVALAPLLIYRARYRGFKVRKIGFAQNPQSPSNEILLRSGAQKALALIAAHLGSFAEWALVDLQRLEVGGQTRELLDREFSQQELRTGSRFNFESPYIPIDCDWESFLRRRSARFRKSLRNKLNRGSGLSVECSGMSADDQALLDELQRISSRSWKHAAGSDLASSAANVRFYRELCRLFGASGQVRVWWLKKAGETIAFEFHLTCRGVVYPLRADFDEAYRDLSPGSLLEHHLLKDLFDNRSVREYNTCGHTYRYLLNWTGRTRSYIALEAFRPNAPMQALHGFEYRLLPLLRKAHLPRLVNSLRKRMVRGARQQPA